LMIIQNQSHPVLVLSPTIQEFSIAAQFAMYDLVLSAILRVQ
jgi:hypothetical protein